jgi:hypothetical protein
MHFSQEIGENRRKLANIAENINLYIEPLVVSPPNLTMALYAFSGSPPLQPLSNLSQSTWKKKFRTNFLPTFKTISYAYVF